MNATPFRRAAAVLAAVGLLAGCASGESIISAGVDTDGSSPFGAGSEARYVSAPGETLPLSADDLARCPADALHERDPSDGPVMLTMWYGASGILDETLTALVDEYNASQDRVQVRLQNQNGYLELGDKYFQATPGERPDIAQFADYFLQQVADTNTTVPVGACIASHDYDTSAFLDPALLAYQTGGVQWSLPFNVSNPVLYYNMKMFEDAGLDPTKPPVTLEELRSYSEQIVESGAATYGIAFDTGVDSGGGWFVEQWLARAGLQFANNGNGREARATEVTFNRPETVKFLTDVQSMVTDGIAVNVGANPSGQDVVLKMADPNQPAAMGITTSAGLGTVLSVVDAGLVPGITSDDVGIGPMPGPSPTPSALVGGAALYIVDHDDPLRAAASWDLLTYLASPEVQSEWAATTGYIPVRTDALDVEPVKSVYVDDPRFRVAFDQLTGDISTLSGIGPALGPMRQVREITATMMEEIYNGVPVPEALDKAESTANLFIIDYANRNP